jgi:hypothetical protein
MYHKEQAVEGKLFPAAAQQLLAWLALWPAAFANRQRD